MASPSWDDARFELIRDICLLLRQRLCHISIAHGRFALCTHDGDATMKSISSKCDGGKIPITTYIVFLLFFFFSINLARIRVRRRVIVSSRASPISAAEFSFAKMHHRLSSRGDTYRVVCAFKSESGSFCEPTIFSLRTYSYRRGVGEGRERREQTECARN